MDAPARLTDRILHKITRWLGLYYTYDEVIKRLEEETGMYEKFIEACPLFDSMQDIMLSKHMYYDALTDKLSFDSPDKKTPKYAREYYKSSVEGFLDEQRKRQERGELPFAIIFYRGFTNDEINNLTVTDRSNSWCNNF